MYLQRPARVPNSGLNVLPWVWIVVALIVAANIAAILTGCNAFRIPEEPATPTPVSPVWSPQELYQHVRYLNRTDVDGRTTGTQGYARAAAYVASRMRDFGLQPAIEGDYRVIYGAPINYPVSGMLRVAGPSDSLDFLPGVDFLPDGRSDSGAVAVSRFVVAGEDVDPGRSRDRRYGILVPPGENPDLRAWRKAGAELAIFVDSLYPRYEQVPVKGLLVVQATPETARELLRIGATAVAPYFSARHGEIISLGRTVHAQVNTISQPQAGAINMMGYFSGKHPVRRRELVVVCAHLDAVGQYAGVPMMDFRNFGTSTAALLEVSRNLGYITRRWQLPERSVMIAVWSGSRLGHAGLRSYLEHPTWETARISSVVYVGLSPGEQIRVKGLLDEYGIQLIAIPPSEDAIYPADVLILPDPALERVARAQGRPFEAVERPDMSQLIDSAVVRAIELAEDAFEMTMIESTAPSSFAPMPEDSLRVPSTEILN